MPAVDDSRKPYDGKHISGHGPHRNALMVNVTPAATHARTRPAGVASSAAQAAPLASCLRLCRPIIPQVRPAPKEPSP